MSEHRYGDIVEKDGKKYEVRFRRVLRHSYYFYRDRNGPKYSMMAFDDEEYLVPARDDG